MHGFADRSVVLAVSEWLELLDSRGDLVEVDGLEFPDIDLRVAGAVHFFGIEAKFFEELFAGPCARKDDGDILFRLSAELDEVSGEVDDFDRFAHIEDEDFAILPHGACLHDELAGLRDGHEIADHIGMCDRDGAARADLRFKEREDAAGRPEDISETDGAEARLAECGHALDIELGDAFARAHDACGVDGLVGGDHDESGAIVRDSAVRNHHGAFDVVADGFAGVVLEHGDMLVCGCMEDDFRRAFVEDFVHPGFVANIRESGDDLGVSCFVAEFAFDFIEEEFATLEEDEF